MKPHCQKCTNTGRTCDGYVSPFRPFTTSSIKIVHDGGIESVVTLQPDKPGLTEISPQDIDLLNRYFSTKTIFDVDLDCATGAKQILQAGLTEPSIQHAILSLKALREDFEISRDVSISTTQQASSYDYGIQQYCMALGGLSSKLSTPGCKRLKSALLCCQIFISIEQVRGNYGSMIQHMIRGLGIMREYHVRSYLDPVPRHKDQLPFLDVFIIKLITAPCKFADIPAPSCGTPASSISPSKQPIESQDLRKLAPNLRTELTRIAASTLKFLDQLSAGASAAAIAWLLSEKTAVLDALESWLTDLKLTQTQNELQEPVSVSFLRLFHQILKIILLGTINSSPETDTQLKTENDRLQDLATIVDERVKAYGVCNWSRSGGAEQSKV